MFGKQGSDRIVRTPGDLEERFPASGEGQDVDPGTRALMGPRRAYRERHV